MPVSQLVEARVIFAAAPAMGHNQVSYACSFVYHLDTSSSRLCFKNKESNHWSYIETCFGNECLLQLHFIFYFALHYLHYISSDTGKLEGSL